MPYGILKVDTITFTDNSVDKSVSLSGLIQNPTFTGNVTATGTISGAIIAGGGILGTSGIFTNVSGITANFVSGVFTSLTGTTTTGITANFTSGNFGNTTVTGNLTINAQGDLRLADADSSNFIALQSPATVTSNVTFTLPSGDGTAGQALVTNGSAILEFASAGGGVSMAKAFFFSGF